MRPSLLTRFPSLRAPTGNWPVIPPNKQAEYPALAEDFAVLDRDLAPSFDEYDQAALRDQNRYRRQQVTVLLGSALATGLGGLQALFPSSRIPGLVIFVIGLLLAFSMRWAGERAALTDYLSERVKAERLRALHFRYLARAGPYAGPDRERALRHAVLAIRAGRELA